MLRARIWRLSAGPTLLERKLASHAVDKSMHGERSEAPGRVGRGNARIPVAGAETLWLVSPGVLPAFPVACPLPCSILTPGLPLLSLLSPSSVSPPLLFFLFFFVHPPPSLQSQKRTLHPATRQLPVFHHSVCLGLMFFKYKTVKDLPGGSALKNLPAIQQMSQQSTR